MSDQVRASLEELHTLAKLIKTSVDSIEKIFVAKGQQFPSLDGPLDPQSEAVRMSAEVQQAGNILVAAASQLIATVRPPPVTALVSGFQFHISACLRVAVENHVVEILKAAGPQGLHVRDVAAPTKVNPEKLARVLRTLATHHIFKEVSPDVFTNNAVSSALDTGKPVYAILADPESKYDNTSGLAAAVGHSTDEVMKGAGYLQEVISDPIWSASGDPAKTPFAKAFNVDVPMWEWFESPANSTRLRRFGAAMGSLTHTATVGALTAGFDWAALPKDSLVVDVGGGVGTQTMALAKAFDHLKFIVQDRESVITGSAPGYWKETLPEAIDSGRVSLKAHDFFTPQPVHGPAIFLMRCIIHDWADEYAIKILRQLRDAAAPTTQLVVIDSIISYACPAPENTKSIEGLSGDSFPKPLLPNHGVANAFPILVDMQMMVAINATERTVDQFDKLFEQGGWKLIRVYLADGTVTQGSKLVAVPA
ncbi:O-methyltransferase [Irpex lacteus]|nr:O-methyltransferase [Irpex lacteus]